MVLYDHLDAAGMTFGVGGKWEEFMAQGVTLASHQHHGFRILSSKAKQVLRKLVVQNNMQNTVDHYSALHMKLPT